MSLGTLLFGSFLTVPNRVGARFAKSRSEKSILCLPDERDTKVFGALAVALESLESRSATSAGDRFRILDRSG